MAPGAPIVGDKPGTLTALLQLDGEPYALTCGHIFTGGRALYHDGREVATLTHNFCHVAPWLDAAVARLNDAGRDAIDTAHNREWWVTNVREPNASIKRRGGYLLGRGATRPLAVEITAHNRRVAAFLRKSRIGLILTRPAGAPGDSGAPLYVSRNGKWRLLGMQIGAIDGLGCHVPLLPVLAALRLRHERVYIL
ncbi:MAG: hypothetical protein H6713_04505 [Myxococcales bacterium]|nr:hypothetical protein [Myxococcales bacterium]